LVEEDELGYEYRREVELLCRGFGRAIMQAAIV
jgi:hypothetical protein